MILISLAMLASSLPVDFIATGVVLEFGVGALVSGLGFPLVFAGAGPKDREQ